MSGRSASIRRRGPEGSIAAGRRGCNWNKRRRRGTTCPSSSRRPDERAPETAPKTKDAGAPQQGKHWQARGLETQVRSTADEFVPLSDHPASGRAAHARSGLRWLRWGLSCPRLVHSSIRRRGLLLRHLPCPRPLPPPPSDAVLCRAVWSFQPSGGTRNRPLPISPLTEAAVHRQSPPRPPSGLLAIKRRARLGPACPRHPVAPSKHFSRSAGGPVSPSRPEPFRSTSSASARHRLPPSPDFNDGA